ncbi:hypothetical protein K1719_008812 [Acacia pycnantha]|nr:hypothetical protein K1719_008812 [Acacia pycnantha]
MVQEIVVIVSSSSSQIKWNCTRDEETARIGEKLMLLLMLVHWICWLLLFGAASLGFERKLQAFRNPTNGKRTLHDGFNIISIHLKVGHNICTPKLNGCNIRENLNRGPQRFAAVVHMRAPLVELRDKIEQFRGSVEGSLVSMKNGLRQRSEASSARETLELLLDTFHVVSKIDELVIEGGKIFWSSERRVSKGTKVQSSEMYDSESKSGDRNDAGLNHNGLETEFLNLHGRDWIGGNLMKLEDEWNLTFGITCWLLWNWRNRRRFEEGFNMPEEGCKF